MNSVNMSPATVETRATLSGGTSEAAIYHMVTRAILQHKASGGTILDVGCGRGELWAHAGQLFSEYHGADVIRYEGLPDTVHFHRVDLDSGRIPVEDAFADVVAAVETIEHLENPRAFVRELCRVTKAGGWIVVTTPNTLSLLSKLTLVVKNHFNAFQDSCYPAHITALVEHDLRRIAAECGLTDSTIHFTVAGRVPGTAWSYPAWLSRLFPRALSDNIMLMARKSAFRS